MIYLMCCTLYGYIFIDEFGPECHHNYVSAKQLFQGNAHFKR